MNQKEGWVVSDRRRDDALAITLGRMEEKLDRVVEDVKEFRQELSPRVRSLENWRSGIAATLTGLGLALAYLFKGGN